MKAYSVHEAKRYEFYEYTDSLFHKERHLGDRFPPGTSRLEKYRYMVDRIKESERTTDPMEQALTNLTLAESDWYSIGCPYYKVWPAIGNALAHTEMSIDGEHLHFPHPCFVIRFPKEDNPAPYFAAALVAKAAWPEDRAEGGFRIFLAGQLASRQSRFDFFPIRIRPGKLVETSVMEALNGRILDYAGLSETETRELMRHFVPLYRIAVGVCFFGTDRHEMVMPDLTRKIIDKYQYRLRRQPTEEELAEAIEQSKRQGLGGFKIGAEIDLPKPELRYHGDYMEGTGRELTCGHVRRGHMRIQPVGPGRKDRRLVFVPPCVVRPDLPMGQPHGYRIRDNAAQPV